MKIKTHFSKNLRVANLFKPLVVVIILAFSTYAYSQPNYRPINVNLIFPGSAVPPGNNLTADCKIKNLGNAGGGASVIGYYLSVDQSLDGSDVLLGTAAVGAVSCCKAESGLVSKNLVIPGGTAYGQYHILFVADNNGQVAESDEGDNVKYKEFDVGVSTQPDLLPISIALNIGSVAPGGSVTASCKIRNIGSGIGGFNDVGFYLSSNTTLDGGDLLLGTDVVGNLSPLTNSGSKSASLAIPGGTPVGNYFILYVADYLNAVPESNEGNNVKSVPLSVLAAGNSDVLPINLSISAGAVSAGNPVSVNCKIRNIGANPTVLASEVGYYLSSNTTLGVGDILLGSAAVGNLNPLTNSGDKPKNLVIPAPTPPGNYYILYVADHNNDLAETNEGNNLKNRPITVNAGGGLPDLVPINIVLGSNSVSAGASTNASCKARNIGTASAGFNSVGFYLSSNTTLGGGDVLLGSEVVGVLAPSTSSGSKSATLNIPGGTAPGIYYILYVVDNNSVIGESDEVNNVKFRQIQINPNTPNLRPININLTIPGAGYVPVSGGVLPATCRMKNLGSGPSGASHVAYYLSDNLTLGGGDIRLDEVAVGPVAGGGAESVFLPANLAIPAQPMGTYYILFVADDYNAVIESDESDNVKFKEFNIGPPPPFMGKTSAEPILGNILDLKQYPNPSSGNVFIEFTSLENSSENVELHIYDMNGTLIFITEFTDVITQVKYELDVSNLSSGVYNFVYQTKDNVVSKKLIIANH